MIVPEIHPGNRRFWTYLSGVAEIAIGLAPASNSARIIAGKSIRLRGAIAALDLFVTVYTANIKMAIDWSSRKMPDALIAYARLPLQFPLFYWAWKVIKN